MSRSHGDTSCTGAWRANATGGVSKKPKPHGISSTSQFTVTISESFHYTWLNRWGQYFTGTIQPPLNYNCTLLINVNTHKCRNQLGTLISAITRIEWKNYNCCTGGCQQWQKYSKYWEILLNVILAFTDALKPLFITLHEIPIRITNYWLDVNSFGTFGHRTLQTTCNLI